MRPDPRLLIGSLMLAGCASMPAPMQPLPPTLSAPDPIVAQPAPTPMTTAPGTLATDAAPAPDPAARLAWIPPFPQEVGHGGHDPHADHHHGAGSHAFNVFLGGSSDVGNQDAVALGLDYEYRIRDRLGVGAFVEGLAGGLERSFTAGGQIYWHAIAQLVLVGGAGAERAGNEWHGILRAGGFYEFFIGEEHNYVISPAVFYDVSSHHDILVYGVNLGVLF